MDANDRQVSVSRVIAAAPEQIFAVLNSPSGHAMMDGSGTVQGTRDGQPATLKLGTKFGMKMKIGVPYRITNTVVEYEENRLIAWQHVGGHRWRYTLEPVDGGTQVTETFDWSTSKMPWLIKLMNFPMKHRPNMEKTLERLEAQVC